MAIELVPIKYVDYKVYSITKIKKKYGFRVLLKLNDMTEKTTQHAGFENKEIAEKERYKVIADLETGKYVVYSNITVRTYMEYWYEYIAKKRLNSEGSIDTYKNAVFNHIIKNIGNLKIIDLKKGHIKKLYKDIYEYSKSVASIVKTVLNSALEDATINNFIPVNVAKGEDLPRDKTKGKSIKTKEEKKEEQYKKYHTLVIDERKTFKFDEIILLIKESKNTPIYLHILFATLMGLRKSEINGLKYSDIDYLHRKLYLKIQLGKKKGVKKENVAPKTFTKQEIPLKTKSSERVLDIPDLVFEAILEERKKYEENKKRRINDKTNPFQDLGYICCSTHGRPRSRGYLYKHFLELKQKINVTDLPFHKLRTTYTTILAKNDFSMKAIAELLGHSSEIITFENYTDKNEIIQDCLTELEPFIEKIIPNNKTMKVDCTDIQTDLIIDEYLNKLNVS